MYLNFFCALLTSVSNYFLLDELLTGQAIITTKNVKLEEVIRRLWSLYSWRDEFIYKVRPYVNQKRNKSHYHFKCWMNSFLDRVLQIALSSSPYALYSVLHNCQTVIFNLMYVKLKEQLQFSDL